jgi:hypothetical protein
LASKLTHLYRLGRPALMPFVWLPATQPAHAESHAIIVWIGQYADPRANLPGIEFDAKPARRIAEVLGVPAGNITELKIGQLTLGAMGRVLTELAERIKTGNRVSIYYSGDGRELRGLRIRRERKVALFFGAGPTPKDLPPGEDLTLIDIRSCEAAP